ncbi:MAG TPA: efflux RND transporter periplasmic adaptor subunit [Thermoanaerobaculia bacterium]|nr:efflux RND transporter periplasmic adaptor subunit [Thermoanaerobaculia bacterium]
MKPTLMTVLLTGLAGLLAAGCGGGDGAAASGPGGWSGGPPPAVVTTAPVEQGAFAVDARFVATLEAKSAADLYARISGPIVQVYADSGDRVRAGQLLARIQPDEAEKQVAQAQAALRIAEATLSQRQANLEVAGATARRTEKLFEQDLVSQQDYDMVQAELVGARSQLELARAQIEQARTNLGSARLELEKTRLVAPFDGFVGQRYLDLGDFAATNRPLFSVVDLSTIVTTISITEKDAARVLVGQDARVTTQTYPGRVFEGQVARMASVFDPQTNTTEAEIEIDNPDAALKPGMFGAVSVTYRTEPTALLVPASAVVEGETESHVFVAERAAPEARSRPGGGEDEPGGAPAAPRWVARRVAVQVVGAGSGGRSAIEPTAGGELLGSGTRVVVLGQQTLTDGAAIVLDEPAAQEARS